MRIQYGKSRSRWIPRRAVVVKNVLRFVLPFANVVKKCRTAPTNVYERVTDGCKNYKLYKSFSLTPPIKNDRNRVFFFVPCPYVIRSTENESSRAIIHASETTVLREHIVPFSSVTRTVRGYVRWYTFTGQLWETTDPVL